ncbi:MULTISPECIES: SURF1 family protein [Phenylobacterium]|uniref:SURF1-like protein n=1 Tax=Phenylobacterium koreense TaxID=266125 RepID=A0ABV2EHD3_9CAUL
MLKVTIGALVLVAAFVALGVWQVQRLAWKTELIAQVEGRIHAAPTAAPGPGRWPTITREADQYRQVFVRGRYMHDDEALVQAVSDLGAGFWVMTPMRTDQGFVVLVNRGFVPADRRKAEARAAGQVAGEQEVTGLLRITEPHGGFLRANEPAKDLWRSRDVQAIAASRRLGEVAPYFIDADATPNPGGWPRGGLTVVRFPNSHLAYALTWFGMALLTVVGWVVVVRHRGGDAR